VKEKSIVVPECSHSSSSIHILPHKSQLVAVSYAGGNPKGSIEAILFHFWRIQTALIMAAAKTLPGNFTLLERFLNKVPDPVTTTLCIYLPKQDTQPHLKNCSEKPRRTRQRA